METAQLLQALAFAADKHRRQRRKDAEASPYINHPIAVATVLAVDGEVSDHTLILAAVLHDTVEDTETTAEELDQLFGSKVAGLVAEVTDDKALPKTERKRLQIEHARNASPAAKQLKIADKVCNLRDMCANPPADWPTVRRLEYLAWACDVVEGCRGVSPRLDAVFDEVVVKARKCIEDGS